MSKVLCPQCNTAYTHTTGTCPSCGTPRKTKPVLSKQMIIIIVVADILALIGLIAGFIAFGIIKL